MHNRPAAAAIGGTGRAARQVSTVIEGLGRTGRLVTGAAAILMLSFVSMATNSMTDLKILATGLGVGIFVDAMVVRCVALTAAEWRAVGFKIARRNGLSASGEMFSWPLSSAGPSERRTLIRQLPPPARVLCKVAWKPRYDRTSRW